MGTASPGDTRSEFTELFNVYWPIGLAVLVIIWGLVAFAVWRFRSDSTEPAGGKASSHAEEAYAGVLVVVVAVLLYFTYDTMSSRAYDVEASAGEKVVVDVTAAQWNWRFEYPELGIVEHVGQPGVSTLVVPEDTPIEFRHTSADVIHSFWIPALRFKRDAFPGRTTASC